MMNILMRRYPAAPAAVATSRLLHIHIPVSQSGVHGTKNKKRGRKVTALYFEFVTTLSQYLRRT